MCKNVQKIHNKEKKKSSTMAENVNSRSITTKPNQTIFGDKSTSIQFYGQWR